MDLAIKKFITLDDGKEYVITSMAKYENDDYLYLVDINNMENIKFCKLISHDGTESLQEIKDDAILSKIIPILYASVKEEINN